MFLKFHSTNKNLIKKIFFKPLKKQFQNFKKWPTVFPPIISKTYWCPLEVGRFHSIFSESLFLLKKKTWKKIFLWNFESCRKILLNDDVSWFSGLGLVVVVQTAVQWAATARGNFCPDQAHRESGRDRAGLLWPDLPKQPDTPEIPLPRGDFTSDKVNNIM